MKARLKDRVIAESDDIVAEGGYHYFPISVVRMEWLEKAAKTELGPRLPAWRSVLRCGDRREALSPRRLDLRGAASLDAACGEPLRLLGRRRGGLIQVTGRAAGCAWSEESGDGILTVSLDVSRRTRLWPHRRLLSRLLGMRHGGSWPHFAGIRHLRHAIGQCRGAEPGVSGNLLRNGRALSRARRRSPHELGRARRLLFARRQPALPHRLHSRDHDLQRAAQRQARRRQA